MLPATPDQLLPVTLAAPWLAVLVCLAIVGINAYLHLGEDRDD